MRGKHIFFHFFILTVSLSAFAQPPAGEPVAVAFRKAEESLVLLRNQEDLIPLQRLDTLRIALVGIGLKEGCAFQGILEKYTQVKTLMPPLAGDLAGIDEWLGHISSNFNLVIVGINDFESGEQAYEQFEYPLRRLMERNRCILAVFGGERAFRQVEWLGRADGLVVTPVNSYAHSLAAQLIFGGVGASGRLGQSLSDEFPAGAGLSTKGNLRLRYSPPEAVGMNAQMLRDSINAIVTQGIAAGAYPGAQVVVVKDGHVIYQEAFGYQTYDSIQAVTNKDIYDYASMTKITGALPALMKLYGEGKFDLDAPLQKYFPDFKRSNKGDLSFRSMLAHNARLRPWVPYWQGTLKGNARYPWKKNWDAGRTNDYRFRGKTFRRDSSRQYPIRITGDLWLYDRFKERSIYRAIKKSPLNEEPGYVYSGLLFYLLPDMIVDLTGRDFETYVKENFYHRLGAYTITFNPMKHFPLERIVPTERDTFFRMEQIHGVVHDEGAAMMGGVSSNAGLFSTANDLAKLLQLYLNFGSYGGERLIPAAALEEFTRYQYPEEGNRRGLGFDKPLLEYTPEDSYVAKSASAGSFGHTGYTGTFAWADPESKLLLVFFSNRVYTTRNNRKLYTLNIRPRLHQVCYDAIVKEYEK